MNLNEMGFDEQVRYLRSLLNSGKNSLLGYLALFAFRHHLASRHSPGYTTKPVLRWYLGQLAKEYIKKYFNQAKTNIENLSDIGLLEIRGEEPGRMEFHLNEDVFPALRDVLEGIFGKECIQRETAKAKYFRNRRLDENFSEVRE